MRIKEGIKMHEARAAKGKTRMSCSCELALLTAGIMRKASSAS
jgi:hypothetical protein